MTRVLITGCSGFIGSHLTNYFLNQGALVTGIDNLSRYGSEKNLDWLKCNQKIQNFAFFKKDIRKYNEIQQIFKKNRDFDLIIHEAAQVAVTTSVTDPRLDFEVNALGTFNILEAARTYSPDAFFEYASTNKVYGKMDDLKIIEENGRYEYDTMKSGICEDRCLDFHSPYGCSKGAAEQYVHDYYRIYGLKTVVLRQSCIYGTRQFGIEDQGWISWFVIASILKKPLTIYGDGKQVRDILWIDDLVAAYVELFARPGKTCGKIFNIGGGPENCISIHDLVNILKEEGILKNMPKYEEWRPGDQKIYVSNINKITKAIGWRPKVSPKDGIKNLIRWCTENKKIINGN